MILTKSKYLVGLECPKHLWRMFNNPKSIRKPTKAEEFKFKEGDKVGELAKKLFSNGIDLPLDYKENIQASKDALGKKVPLFEAGFEFNNCFSRADVLVPVGNKWDIIEVKSGTRVKDINVHDVSFQKYVYEGVGLKIRKCFLLHLNKEYVRKGKIDINELFVKEDITEKVNLVKGVKSRIKKLFGIVSLDKEPRAGFSLDKVFKEGFHDCWYEGCVNLDKNNVFSLYRGGKLSKELFNNGVKMIKDIPYSVKLNKKQKIQRDCELEGSVYVDKEKIRDFLSSLIYPLYCLDFESFSTAIPMFDGLKCYSQVCFQFSLHVVGKDKVKHYEWLYDGSGDPRDEFIIELERVVKGNGSVVVYNKSFEVNRLKEFGEERVRGILDRIVDLLDVFRGFYYYNPLQEGSASIKKVLPALVGKDYSSLDIGDGGSASVEFYEMVYGDGSDVRDSLLEYCKLDTMAEVMLIERLSGLVVGGRK